MSIGAPEWGPILPFIGALVGALLAPPFMEIFKHKFGPRLLWLNRRDEIIERVRFVNANINAFWDLLTRASGDWARSSPEQALLYDAALRQFDFTPALAATQHLLVLGPRKSASQGAAQHLVGQLLTLFSLMQVLQKSPLDKADIKMIEERLNDYRVFLASVYSSAMGIPFLSLAIDFDAMKFDGAMSKMRMDEAMAKLNEARKAWEDWQSRQAEQTERDEDDKPRSGN